MVTRWARKIRRRSSNSVAGSASGESLPSMYSTGQVTRRQKARAWAV
jgi:hypothetical protein